MVKMVNGFTLTLRSTAITVNTAENCEALAEALNMMKQNNRRKTNKQGVRKFAASVCLFFSMTL